MSLESGWRRISCLIQTEWQHLTRFNSSDRLWQLPLAAAFASGLPLMVGAYFDRMDFGQISSLGALAFLYLPNTVLSHRMVTLMSCVYGMIFCYTLGLISHFFPRLMMPTLTFIVIAVMMVCRFFRLPPPGALFFIMAASIGMYTPGEAETIPLRVGLLTLGALLASLIALFYSVYAVRRQPPRITTPLPPPTFDHVVFDPIVIGVFVGLSLALAQGFSMERAYWVPISCLAVMQGESLRAVWNRQLHRVIGTGIGLLLTWGLLTLPLNNMSVALTMMALAFAIEMLIVRHYGLAAVFITPVAIFLAEFAALAKGSPLALIEARLYDTLLGCLVGFVGGICLHNPRFRDCVGRQMRRLIPQQDAPKG